MIYHISIIKLPLSKVILNILFKIWHCNLDSPWKPKGYKTHNQFRKSSYEMKLHFILFYYMIIHQNINISWRQYEFRGISASKALCNVMPCKRLHMDRFRGSLAISHPFDQRKSIYYVRQKAETHENRRFLSTGMGFAENANAYVLKAPSRC